MILQTVFRTYQFKLKPNASQAKTFEEWLGICRFVYNKSLEVRKYYLDNKEKQPTSFDLNYQLNEVKKSKLFPFLYNVHSQVLQEANERTKKTVDRLFKTWKSGKHAELRFKNKYTYNSFTFKRDVKVDEKYIKLPKIGKVRYFNSRPIPENAKIKYVSVIRKDNKWFINIQLEFETEQYTIDDSQAVGIDVGVKIFAYLSNGETIYSNYFLEPNLAKLRVLQRKLSRCKKGSNRREKIRKQVAKLHSKIANQRRDFNHKVSTQISKEFDVVVIEDLKISNMIKLNSTLSRRMLDNGFYQFRTFLDYKAKELIAVPPMYTSQTCSSCGAVDKKSRLSQSEFVCTSCGFVSNADLNASKNILAMGKSLRTQRKPLG